MCKDAKALLLVSTLFTFAMGLSNIFVNVFFWKQTKDFKVIVIYNLMHYIVIPMVFILAGIIAKRKNGIWPLRFGLLAYTIFFAVILWVGGKGGAYIYVLGVIHGIGSGFYWLAFNTLCFDYTDTNNRDTFNGFNGSCAGIASAASPITAAYIISRFEGVTGYNIVFAITLTIFIVLLLISLALRCKNYAGKLDFKKAFSSNCEEWSMIRRSTVSWGFRDVIIVFLVNILIIETTKSELSLGQLTLFASLVSSASYVLVQKVIKPPQRKLSIMIGTIGSFVAILGLGLKVEYSTLLFYVIADALFIPFYMIQLTSSTYNVISRAHDEDLRVEYMINRDLMLNGGRIVSVGILLILLHISAEIKLLQGYLVFIGLAPIVSGYFLSKLKKVLLGEPNQ
jgi:YQGE family putative transporter